MSTSRAKQKSQGRKSKTKPNGTKYSWAKNQKMRTGPQHLWHEKRKKR